MYPTTSTWPQIAAWCRVVKPNRSTTVKSAPDATAAIACQITVRLHIKQLHIDTTRWSARRGGGGGAANGCHETRTNFVQLWSHMAHDFRYVANFRLHITSIFSSYPLLYGTIVFRQPLTLKAPNAKMGT